MSNITVLLCSRQIVFCGDRLVTLGNGAYQMVRPNRLDSVLLALCAGILFLAVAGLLLSTAFRESDRIFFGSASLLGAGGFAILTYIQLRFQVVLVHESWFTGRFTVSGKSERPIAYLISTMVYTLATLVTLGSAIFAFIAGVR